MQEKRRFPGGTVLDLREAIFGQIFLKRSPELLSTGKPTTVVRVAICTLYKWSFDVIWENHRRFKVFGSGFTGFARCDCEWFWVS